MNDVGSAKVFLHVANTISGSRGPDIATRGRRSVVIDISVLVVAAVAAVTGARGRRQGVSEVRVRVLRDASANLHVV